MAGQMSYDAALHAEARMKRLQDDYLVENILVPIAGILGPGVAGLCYWSDRKKNKALKA
jgi:hypothetical protein